MDLTKRQTKAALGIDLDIDLAEFFDVSKAAVSAWAEDEPLPLARQWQAAFLRPDLFGRKPQRQAVRKAKKHGRRGTCPHEVAPTEATAGAEQ